MRDIEFRGKQTDNGEWVYGVPTKDGRGEMVMVENIFECEEYNCRGANCLYVDENTVGQYTGLEDKNGTKIFEGDIVKRFWFDIMCIYQIDYDNVLACFVGRAGMNFTAFYCDSEEFEVVGNIYDNKLEDFNNTENEHIKSEFIEDKHNDSLVCSGANAIVLCKK